MTVVVEPERGTASSHYDLLARLATGGMAEIFLARENSIEGFERYVVLKRIRPDHGDDPRWVRMFLDEARLAAQLQHPNIAQVFDLGRIGDDLFYTMEYVHGKDVLDIVGLNVQRGISIPINVVMAIITGAAAGLAHAHERCTADGRHLGIVHRDVSPANLMVSFEGTVKVVDFGVAKARYRSNVTEAGTIVGKLAYLSPEQCLTRDIDHRSDIFSLGTVMYELITERRAFKREQDYETLRAVVHDDLPLPSEMVGGIPPGLDHVIMRALEKDPARRFQNGTELIDAIEEVAERAGLALTTGTLRRYMRDLYGGQPEPWQSLEVDEDSIEYSGEIEGLPIDALAEDVPMLQATGMIDISALFARSEIIGPAKLAAMAQPPPPSPRPRSLTGPAMPAVRPRMPTGPMPLALPLPAPPTPMRAVVTPAMASLVVPDHSGPPTQVVRSVKVRGSRGYIVPARSNKRPLAIAALLTLAALAGFFMIGQRFSRAPAASIVMPHHVIAPATSPPPPPPAPPPPAPPVIESALPSAARLPPVEQTVTVVAPAAKAEPPKVTPVVHPAPAATTKRAAAECTDPLDCQY